jgi:hypothetical protein
MQAVRRRTMRTSAKNWMSLANLTINRRPVAAKGWLVTKMAYFLSLKKARKNNDNSIKTYENRLLFQTRI